MKPETFRALAWVHPVVLALIWTHAIAHCTRLPAGEVDRGTIDILMAMPVSRWQLYLIESMVWLGVGALLIVLAATGITLGSRFRSDGSPLHLRLALITASNLFCLYICVGGMAWFVSSLSNRRGKAVAVVLTCLLITFLLDFLAMYWPEVEGLSAFGLLHYYRPAMILQDGNWPLQHMGILLAIGFVLWGGGGFVFARRDLVTL